MKLSREAERGVFQEVTERKEVEVVILQARRSLRERLGS